jgi:drug/metabolite transporter (DMT)-like permease
MPIVLALGAALLFGVGFVLQQHEAQTIPPTDEVSWRLIRYLVVRKRWLAGVCSMVCGQVLGAIALGAASITLVEPLLTTNILIALALAKVLSGQALDVREWFGAVALAVGVAGFVVAADPQPGAGHGPLDRWLFLGGVALAAAVVATVGRHGRGDRRAACLAGAAGGLYGLQDGLTRRGMLLLGHGPTRLLADWSPYAIVAVALVGLVLAQNAFEAAPLRVSLPLMTVTEPTIGIAYGVVVSGDRLREGTTWLQALSLVVAIIGCVAVTRSPALAPIRDTRPPPDARRSPT